ncbi:MAG: glycoside hydrolase family 43 protein [Treponema sp.]|jgi:GH43 family beta-xylosidase|nr:glycoside hydrolase family 43 protein [Treponema sp.]
MMNPIVVKPSADPWLIQAGGFYYHCYSDGRVHIRKAASLAAIGEGLETTVWTPPPDTMYSKDIWAPELHYCFGHWYIYVACDNGDNAQHRMYALEGGADPLDPLSAPYTFKGKVRDAADKWAIDGTVLPINGVNYFVWSGWEDNVDIGQNLYIACMNDPCSLSERVLIATPEYEWEKHDLALLEGPEALIHGSNVFIVYSASASWTRHYCLGLLKLTGDPLNPAHWTKHPEPVFKASERTGVFGVGHCSFVKVSDNASDTDWIVYHGMTDGEGWHNRCVRAKPFTWNPTGMPVFGEPL